MDQFDRASELEEKERQMALQRSRSGSMLKHIGRCHYCHEAADRLFCNLECREGFEHERRAMARNGGRNAW